jgi:hypothetical protein
MVQVALGGIAGLTVGDACVTTRCTLLEPPHRSTPARVEVRVLGMRVSEETGYVIRDEDGEVAGLSLSFEQQAWISGFPLVV